MLLKYLRYYFIFINFLILTTTYAFNNGTRGASSDIDNIKNMFTSETFGDLFLYPTLIKDYSL